MVSKINKILLVGIVLLIGFVLSCRSGNVTKVFAKLLFVDDYYSNVSFTFGSRTHAYILLLEVMKPDTCFKYITVFYEGNETLSIGEAYEVSFVSVKNEISYVSDKRNDTVFIHAINDLPMREMCQRFILCPIGTYGSYYKVKTIQRIQKNE